MAPRRKGTERVEEEEGFVHRMFNQGEEEEEEEEEEGAKYKRGKEGKYERICTAAIQTPPTYRTNGEKEKKREGEGQ